MTIIIYFDAERKCKQIIRPTKEFNGTVLPLVEHITHTVTLNDLYIKGYHSYEII